MELLIDEAKQYIQQSIQEKKDVFVILCSLNLLNAAIKTKEYKQILNYRDIKPQVSKLVDFLLINDRHYVDELYYDSQQHCMYIRCHNIQFSFHNIILTKQIKAFADSANNISIPWDGIRLQLIASELFELAKGLHKGTITDKDIAEEFEKLIKPL